MAEFVNKFTKGSTTKPIHDSRIPVFEASDADKTLKVDAQGNVVASSTGSLEDIETQVELLQQAIEGKIAFDGEVHIEYGNANILGSELKGAGIYKVLTKSTPSASYELDGILVATKSGDNYNVTWYARYGLYDGYGAADSTIHLSGGPIVHYGLNERTLTYLYGETTQGGIGKAKVSDISGTKLYKHRITNAKISDGSTAVGTSFEFISLDSSPFTDLHFNSTDALPKIIDDFKKWGRKGGAGYMLLMSFNYAVNYGSNTVSIEYQYYYDNPDTGTITDTVTEL